MILAHRAMEKQINRRLVGTMSIPMLNHCCLIPYFLIKPMLLHASLPPYISSNSCRYMETCNCESHQTHVVTWNPGTVNLIRSMPLHESLQLWTSPDPCRCMKFWHYKLVRQSNPFTNALYKASNFLYIVCSFYHSLQYRGIWRHLFH